jgi:hypothetical protein
MPTYTIKPRVAEEPKSRPTADGREKLARELKDHPTTFRITLEKRSGTKWESVEACAEIDLLDDEALTDEEKARDKDSIRDEIVDAIIDATEAEARVDGPTRFRAQGWPERGRRELWTATWVGGPPSLSGELAVERAEVGVQSHNILLASLDRQGRHLDRALNRAQETMDKACANVGSVLESLTSVIKAQREVAAPMVDLERLRLEQQEKALQSTLEFEQEKNTMQMFLEAAGIIGKAVMAERRDKRREDRERRASGEPETIDVEATPTSERADPRADVGPRPSPSSSPPPSPPAAMVVHGERFEDAQDLADLLEDIDHGQRRQLQEIMTTVEWGTMLSASEARDVATYDQRFNEFYDAYTQRSPEEAAKLFATVTSIIGAGSAVLFGLIQNFEQRTGAHV